MSKATETTDIAERMLQVELPHPWRPFATALGAQLTMNLYQRRANR